MRWGTEDGLRTLFGGGAAIVGLTRRNFVFRYRSSRHWLEVFRTYYGPTVKAFEALDGDRHDALGRDIIALLGSHHRGGAGLVVPGEYVEVVLAQSET